jgi:hypothetical protein
VKDEGHNDKSLNLSKHQNSSSGSSFSISGLPERKIKIAITKK